MKYEMVRVIFCGALILIVQLLNAQSIDKSVWGAAGTSLSNGVAVSFTIGEPLVGFVSSSSAIDQGFWAGTMRVEVITEPQDLQGIEVYPNPVNDVLHLYTDNKRVFGITIFAINGQQVLSKRINAVQLEHTIDFSHMSTGVYLLRVFTEENNKGKLFKIIKD